MRRFDRVLLIVNPVARTVSRPTMAVIEKALSADFKLEVLETAERGQATEVAAQAALDGLDLVVVFSGDGTINEVVNGLAGKDAALGVIPGGATNILAQALGMSLDPVEATGVLIARALDGQARTLTLGVADGRYFAVNCGAGVDAAAMARLDSKFPKTKKAFERAAFRAVARGLVEPDDVRLCCLPLVDPALPLRQASPSPGTFRLAHEPRAGARRAADRRVAQVVQRVVGQAVLLQVRPGIAPGPVGHGVDLDDEPARLELVPVHDRRPSPGR